MSDALVHAQQFAARMQAAGAHPPPINGSREVRDREIGRALPDDVCAFPVGKWRVERASAVAVGSFLFRVCATAQSSACRSQRRTPGCRRNGGAQDALYSSGLVPHLRTAVIHVFA